MGNFTPQRFQQRAGSGMPGRVRRAVDGGLESTQRNGKTVEVAPDGRLEVKAARNGGLKQTKDGLMVDLEIVGEKNRPAMNRIADPSAVTAAAIHTTLVQLLDELRRTGRTRS